MSDRLKRWADLHETHGAMRSVSKALGSDLRRLLGDLVERHHLAPNVPPQFSNKAERATVVWGTNGPYDLANLPNLAAAKLSVEMKTNRKGDHLHQFTASVDGQTPTGTSWGQVPFFV